MTPKSPAERKSDQRQRDAKDGVIQVNVRIHESNKGRLVKYVSKLLKPRQESDKIKSGE